MPDVACACLRRAAVTDDAIADLKPNTSTCPRAGRAVDEKCLAEILQQ